MSAGKNCRHIGIVLFQDRRQKSCVYRKQTKVTNCYRTLEVPTSISSIHMDIGFDRAC